MPELDRLLQQLSRAGRPKDHIDVGGRLHDSALGAIYFAKVGRLHKPTSTKLLGKKNKPVSNLDEECLILKTIRLEEQNLYAVTLDNKRSTVRGLDKDKVLFLHDSKRECKEWLQTWCINPQRASASVCKVVWLADAQPSSSNAQDGAVKSVYVNEYMNEALVGLLMSKYVASRIPHIIRTRDVWIQEATGFLLQDYGGTAMTKIMADLSLEEFQSIVMQTLVALAIAQDLVHFKHHDVHLDNVFVNRLKNEKTSEGLRLDSAPSWSYCYGSVTLTIPHHGVLAKLGDFGLATLTDPETQTRIQRADYPLLDAGETEWGAWSSKLQGQESYDAVTFLSKFFLEDELSKCPSAHAKWAQSLYWAIKEALPKVECSTIGRPFRGAEGHLPIKSLLMLPVFSPWITAEPSSVVIYTA